MMKTVVGILLLVAGNFFAIKSFPSVPEVMLMKDGSMRVSPDIGGVVTGIQDGFKLMVISLLLLNAGGLLMFWSSSKKSDMS